MHTYVCGCACLHTCNKSYLLGFFPPFVLFPPFGDWMEDKDASENSSEDIMQRGLNMMSNSPSTGLCGLSYLLCKNSVKKNLCGSSFNQRFIVSPRSSYFAIETLNSTQIMWRWHVPIECLYLNCVNCNTTNFKITSFSNSTTSESPSNPLVFNIHF